MDAAPTTEKNARIPRESLVARLEHGEAYALTLLLAPAGFGKTTLLNLWQAHHARLHPGTRIARLDLTPRDADPVRFFRRLSAAIRQVQPDFDPLAYNSLGAEIALPAEAVSDALLQAFEAVPDRLLLVIDDFQHAHAPLVQHVFSGVLERLPPQVRMVVATRNHPDFSLSRLKLEDRLLLVDGTALRLSRSELDALGRTLGDTPLPDAQAERLLALTEGWVAGVKMALMAWSHSGSLALDALSGTQPEIVDYFAHAVLRDLAPEVRDFLLHTAVFDRFNAALCDTVLGRTDSARVLEHLRSRELFLQPVPERPGWFRYHTLFQDFLANRLRTLQPDDVNALHRGAAQWFLAAGEEELALAHARSANDQALVTAMLRLCADQWLRKGEFNAITRWLGALPDEEVLRDSELVVPLVGALTFSRRFNQAAYYLDALRANPSLASGRFADASTLPFLEVMLQLFQHDTDFRLKADIADLISSSGHRDIRAFALAIVAYHHMLHADHERARQYAAQAKAVLSQLGYFYLESYADLILILCDHRAGNLLPAIGRAETEYARWRDAPRTPTWVNMATAIAVVRYEQNRLEDARQLFEELVPAVTSACATEVIAWVYLTLSRLLAHRGEHTRASRLLGQLENLLTMGNYDRFVSQAAFEGMRQAIARNQPEQAERIAVRHALARRHAQGHWRHPQEACDDSWERYGLTTALWLRARGRLDEAAQVLDTLSITLAHSGLKARAVVVDANRVVIKLLQGNENGALRRLVQLIDDYSLLNINRNVLDEAPGLAAFLGRSQELGNLKLPGLYLDVFRDDLVPEAGAQDPAASRLLTAKEQEILELLRQGLSNTDISERSGTALSTIKWHLKNIYAKLGVANRTEAVALALPARRTGA